MITQVVAALGNLPEELAGCRVEVVRAWNRDDLRAIEGRAFPLRARVYLCGAVYDGGICTAECGLGV